MLKWFVKRYLYDTICIIVKEQIRLSCHIAGMASYSKGLKADKKIAVK